MIEVRHVCLQTQAWNTLESQGLVAMSAVVKAEKEDCGKEPEGEDGRHTRSRTYEMWTQL